MQPPACTEAPLKVRLCSTEEESVSDPKFTFVRAEERMHHFTFTQRCLSILRYLFHCEACACAETAVSNATELWRLMERIARECFWIVDSPRNARYLQSTFQLIEYDVPLCFDSYGLLLLCLEPGDSFLHVNSGAGYACTIAGHLIGPNGANHGVEFREAHREQAQANRESMIRFCPDVLDKVTLPLYHAGFPADLLEGRSKFAKVLVTDCFNNLQDIYEMKRLLAPNGILVTGLMRQVKGQAEVSMLMLKRPGGQIDDDWGTAMHMFHGVRKGMFRRIIRLISREELQTVSRLEVARLNMDAPLPSAMPSLKTLLLRAFAKHYDPIRPLLGESVCLVRITTRNNHLPSLSTQLESLIAAITKFHTQCLEAKDTDLEWLSPAVKEELACVAAALESLGEQFVGIQKYYSWKNGETLELPVLQSVMVWILENVFHLVRYCWEDYYFCCYADIQCIFGRTSSNWATVPDENSPITVTTPLLKAFVRVFSSIDIRHVLEHKSPWNYHLSYAKQMRRTLTKLAARFWADASYLVHIIRAIMQLYEAARGNPFWYACIITGDLKRCQDFLAELKEKALHQSEAFTSIDVFQTTFLGLKQRILCLQREINFLIADASDIAEVQELCKCLRFIGCSALRNFVGSGAVQRCLNPVLELRSVNGEGSLMDSALFHEDLTFLAGHDFQDANPVEDVCDFLVRRFTWDLTEALWMSESVRTDRTLALMERERTVYFLEALKGRLPKSVIEKLF